MHRLGRHHGREQASSRSWPGGDAADIKERGPYVLAMARRGLPIWARPLRTDPKICNQVMGRSVERELPVGEVEESEKEEQWEGGDMKAQKR